MNSEVFKPQKHKWTFTSRFRTGAYGWKASRLAIQRIKEAVSEIKLVNRHDRILAAQGAILFIEKLVPAIREIDDSSGAVGTAVHNALQALTTVIINADADPKTRETWLERLWDAVQHDGYGYLDTLPDFWGELCGEKEIASRWADKFIATVKSSWKSGAYFPGSPACLSCLLAADRNEELLDLLKKAPYIAWHYRRFGVQALIKLGRKADALRYAKESCGLNDNPSEIEEICENILLSSGLSEEAYRQYALPRLVSQPGLPTFRKVVKKYPGKDPQEILMDALANTQAAPGKWFATVKRLGMLELAAELALRSPVEPQTLNRAAKEFLDHNPEFALRVSIASLHWLAQGWGYEVTALDADSAYRIALEAARKLGREKEVAEQITRIIDDDQSPGMFLKRIRR